MGQFCKGVKLPRGGSVTKELACLVDKLSISAVDWESCQPAASNWAPQGEAVVEKQGRLAKLLFGVFGPHSSEAAVQGKLAGLG